jgi:hypothetical protein
MPSFITFLCTTKNGRTERLTIQRGTFLIGRSRDCSVYMPFPEVSRQHCRIAIQPDHSVSFTDVRASSVGILHNGKYKKTGTLNPGDEIFIGDTRFVLIEYAGDVVVQDAPAAAMDQIRIDDLLAEGLSKAESAIQTALGISLVSGKTEQETGDVMSWSDITAISIAAKSKAPLPTEAIQAPPPNQGKSLLVVLCIASMLVAAGAIAVAIWAVNQSRQNAAPPAGAPVPVAPAAR